MKEQGNSLGNGEGFVFRSGDTVHLMAFPLPFSEIPACQELNSIYIKTNTNTPTPNTHPYDLCNLEKENFLYLPSSLKNQRKDVFKMFTANSYFFLLWVVSSIIYLQQTNKMKGGSEAFVELNSYILDEVVSVQGKWTYTRVINHLKKYKIIECDNKYSIGNKSLGYRLTEEYRKDSFCRIKVTDQLLNKRINNHRRKMKEELQPQYKKVYETMMNAFWISAKQAEKYIRQKYTIGTEDYNSRFFAIKAIEAQDIFFVVDNKGNRAHHNLSNLPSDLRKFVHFVGQPIGQVDITNSQPLFFYCSLMNNSNINKEELMVMENIIMNGKFYEFFMDLVGETDREKAKKEVFKDILFGQNFINSAYTEAFKLAFPSISEVIRKVKSKDHSQLAIAMQKEESKFVYQVCATLDIEQVSTIHDSIVSETKYLPYVESKMKEIFFERYGFFPMLKIAEF